MNQIAASLVRGLLFGVAVAAVTARALKEFNEAMSTSTKPDDHRQAFKELGRTLLQQPHVESQDLRAYLQQKYAALFLIGRAGDPLSDGDLEPIARELQHFHHQLDRPQDAALVMWYQTIGVGNPFPLLRLLRMNPEIEDLAVDPFYIAVALRQEPFDSFNKDVSDVALLRERFSI